MRRAIVFPFTEECRQRTRRQVPVELLWKVVDVHGGLDPSTVYLDWHSGVPCVGAHTPRATCGHPFALVSVVGGGSQHVGVPECVLRDAGEDPDALTRDSELRLANGWRIRLGEKWRGIVKEETE